MTDQRCQQINSDARRGMEALRHYVEMRRKAPLKGIGDSVHHIHASTQFEAELRFSDLEAIVASVDVHAAVIEALTIARKRIGYLGSFGSERHQKANEEHFFPRIDAAIRALSQSPATDAVARREEIARIAYEASPDLQVWRGEREPNFSWDDVKSEMHDSAEPFYNIADSIIASGLDSGRKA